MNIYDYAKYIINNITRATVGNALNISDKIETTYNGAIDYYQPTFKEI